MKKILICAVSLLAATTLTACGSSNNSPSSNGTSPASGSGGGSGSDAVKAEIKAKIMADQTGSSASDPFRMDAAKAECTANAVVDALGVDKLRAYGLITADDKLTTKKFNATQFSTADATAVVDALFQCVGGANFASTMQHEIDASLPASMPASARSCIERKLNVAAVRTVIIAELSGHGTAVTQLESSVMSCMSQ